MRIWDISPGYLNRQQLQAELQALATLSSEFPDVFFDPVLRRWQGYQEALAWREALVLAELRLREDYCRAMVHVASAVRWPQEFEVSPAAQLQAVGQGRIARPKSSQELWAQHKYSVMARDPARYRSIGKRVAQGRDGDLANLAEELVLILREVPSPGRLFNALEHLWGYVADRATGAERQAARRSPAALLEGTVELAVRLQEPYLLASTALSDLAIFVGD